MDIRARSKAANGPPMSSAAMQFQPPHMFHPFPPPRAAPPMPPQVLPVDWTFPKPAPPPPPPTSPPPQPSHSSFVGLNAATPKMHSIAESSAKPGVSHVPFVSPTEHPDTHMPVAPAAISLTVKGFAGEYKLEATSVEHAAPIVHLMDRIMTVESDLARQRLHEQQLQNQQLQWQMLSSSIPHMCSLMMSDCGQQSPGHDVQVVPPTTHPTDVRSEPLDRLPKRVKVDMLKPGERRHTSDNQTFSSFYLSQGKTEFKFLQRFTIGRKGEEVVELQHPLLSQCFVIPCCAGFTCTTLLEDAFDKVDWGQVYSALNFRVRSDIIDTKQRIRSALMVSKVRMTSQKFVPNLEYFSPSRGFLLEPQLSVAAGPLTEFFLQIIQKQLQARGKSMTSTLQFGCQLLCSLHCPC